MYRRVFKRVLDLAFGVSALILLAPLFVILTVILTFANRGSGVFFRQLRPGRNGRIFRIIKFRTMTDERDDDGALLPDSRRLTKAGRFIRRTSLDELPQLLNVVKGDMSLVGPRPLLIEYLPLYDDVQRRRHDVKPGMTGWAQVNGRNAISWPQKFEYDVWYADNVSFGLDVKILTLTVIKVFRREGISSGTCETAEPFEK